jgi:hypothetical protein
MAGQPTSPNDDISALKAKLSAAADLETTPAGLRPEAEGAGGGDRVRAAEGTSFFQGLTPRPGDKTAGDGNGNRDPWLEYQLERIREGKFNKKSPLQRGADFVRGRRAG